MNTIYVEALIKILDRIETNKPGSQYSAPDDIKKIIGTVLNDVEIEHHRDMEKLRKLKIEFSLNPHLFICDDTKEKQRSE